MKALALLLALCSTNAQAATFTCGGTGFNSCTWTVSASNVSLADDDIVVIMSTFSTTAQTIIAKRITITAVSPDIEWRYSVTNASVAITITGAPMNGGDFYFKGFKMRTTNTGGGILSFGAGAYTTDFHFVDFEASNAANNAAAALVVNFASANNLTITATRSYFHRDATFTATATRTLGTSIQGNTYYAYFTDTVVSNNVAASNSQAIILSGSGGFFKSYNSTFASKVLNSATVHFGNLPQVIFENTAILNTAGTADVSAAGTVTLNNCGLSLDALTGTSFRISAQDFKNAAALDFRPMSGRSQLTWGGVSQTAYTRDIIGVPWGAPWGVGAYYLPSNLQPIGSGNLRAVPAQFLKVPTLVPVPTQFIGPIQQ